MKNINIKLDYHSDPEALGFLKFYNIKEEIISFDPVEAKQTIYINLAADWSNVKRLYRSIEDTIIKIISHETLHLVLKTIDMNATDELDDVAGYMGGIDYSGFLKEDVFLDMIKESKKNKTITGSKLYIDV